MPAYKSLTASSTINNHPRWRLLIELMRLHRPIGIWLLYAPCAWGLALASRGESPLALYLLFFIGAVLMRSAGCIINDMADRTLDAQVERTHGRPLASGALALSDAFSLLLLLLTLALLTVWLINPRLIIWALFALPMVAAYPFMKRITWWPQAFLGLTFNLGALFSWLTIQGELPLPAILLYAAGFFWTLGYDTIYAYQDMEDDALAGVKSSARRTAAFAKVFCGACYLIMFALQAAAGYVLAVPPLYYLFLLPGLIQGAWQIYALNPQEKLSCHHLFKSNQWLGLLLGVGFQAAFVIKI